MADHKQASRRADANSRDRDDDDLRVNARVHLDGASKNGVNSIIDEDINIIEEDADDERTDPSYVDNSKNINADHIDQDSHHDPIATIISNHIIDSISHGSK